MNGLAPRSINGLALCAGYGGLELGLRLALGRLFRTVCYVERDSYAASVLVARMEDACLDQAPVWDDLSTFDGKPWRGVVDIVTAGIPCQPWSLSGAQRGASDQRWLWPDVAGVIRDVRPRYVFIENVPSFRKHAGLGTLLGDLAALGFDAEWACHDAEAEGAPHRRDRLWILARQSGPDGGGKRYATPTARDWKGMVTGNRKSPDINQQVGGLVHPEFHCWLMGIPTRWTASDCRVTESFQSWLREHSAIFGNDYTEVIASA